MTRFGKVKRPIEYVPTGERPAEEALRRWKDAQRYFDAVSAPALVDYAVIRLEAARQHYENVIAQEKARNAGRMY